MPHLYKSLCVCVCNTLAVYLCYAGLIREFDLIGSSDPYLPEIDDMDTAVVSGHMQVM